MDRQRVFEFMPEEVMAAAAAEASVVRGGLVVDLDFGGSAAPVKVARESDMMFSTLCPEAALRRAESLAGAVQDWRTHSGEAVESINMPSAGPVQVIARVRPLNAREEDADGKANERGSPCFQCTSTVPGAVAVHSEEPALGGAPTGRIRTALTAVHRSYEGTTGDRALLETIVPAAVEAAREGQVVHIVAYGATGTGKTHTAQVLADALAAEMAAASPGVSAHPANVSVSFFENFGDRCFDVFGKTELQVLEDAAGRVQLPGLTADTANGVDELQALIARGFASRRTAATEFNTRSSRSHAVCVLRFVDVVGLPISAGESMPQALPESDDGSSVAHRATGGSIRIVDLAGSERSRETLMHDAERMREAKAVNWSLACLRDCVRAVAQGEARGPFRRSKLTMLLRECFEEQHRSRVVWIAHLAPMSLDLPSTLSTVRCAEELIITGEAAKPPLKPPREWSKAQVRSWLRADPRFAHLAPKLSWADGRTLWHEWLRDLVVRAAVADVSEAEMTDVYEAFRKIQAGRQNARRSRPEPTKVDAATPAARHEVVRDCAQDDRKELGSEDAT